MDPSSRTSALLELSVCKLERALQCDVTAGGMSVPQILAFRSPLPLFQK